MSKPPKPEVRTGRGSGAEETGARWGGEGAPAEAQVRLLVRFAASLWRKSAACLSSWDSRTNNPFRGWNLPPFMPQLTKSRADH